MQESIEHKLELRLRLKSSQISNIDRALARQCMDRLMIIQSQRMHGPDYFPRSRKLLHKSYYMSVTLVAYQEVSSEVKNPLNIWLRSTFSFRVKNLSPFTPFSSISVSGVIFLIL